MSMEMSEQALSRFLLEKHKTMLSEEGDDSSRGSNSSRDSNCSTDSSGSSPHKRPRYLTFAFTPFDELVKLDAEDIVVKDYLDWFISSKAEVNEDEVLLAKNYLEWFETLGSEAKAYVLNPSDYMEWYVWKFGQPLEFPSSADLIEEYGRLALEYYNEENKCDYEYVRDVELSEDGCSAHLNFYGRLKVSPSRPESEAPERLFFAEVDIHGTLLRCRLLDSDEFGDAYVLHPPDDPYCLVCSGPTLWPPYST